MIMKILVIFIIALFSAALYQFYPVFECVRNFGEFAQDCSDAIGLLSIGFALFFVIWLFILLVLMAMIKSRQNPES